MLLSLLSAPGSGRHGDTVAAPGGGWPECAGSGRCNAHHNYAGALLRPGNVPALPRSLVGQTDLQHYRLALHVGQGSDSDPISKANRWDRSKPVSG